MTADSSATRRAPTRESRSGHIRGRSYADIDHRCVRGLPAGLDRVARVGGDEDLPGTDEELARVARDLLLALAEREPGQPAHVLASGAEVGVDALRVHAVPQPGQP